MRTRAELRHYQVRTSTFQIEQERTLCALKMGMGKTASTLTTINDLIDACVITKALVIAPLRVANSVWAQEAKEWEHLKDLKFKICTGTEQKRLAALHHDADVYVINRENVVWLVKHYRDKFPFQMVVVDECFPEGTMILTPTGLRDIKTLEIGESVITSIGEKPITNIFKKESYDLIKLYLSDGTSIECTGNHPFATEKGWIQARGCRGLHFVRNNLYETQINSSVMQPVLFKKTYAQYQNRRTQKRSHGKNFKNSKKELRIWTKNHLEQRVRMVRRSKTKIKFSSQTFWASTNCARREWENFRMREDDEGNLTVRMDNAVCNTHKNGKNQWLSNLLQSRFRNSSKENCVRSRWKLSQIAKAVGRKERYLSSIVRVDSIENIQQSRSRNVFNLQINGINDYFANGILVHNCSSFKSDKSKRVKALRKALPYVHYITLLTGTPSPNGLLDLWSQCYLVDNGKALGRTMTMYKSRFFEQDYSGYKYTPRKDSQKKIEALIAPFTISMETSDYLDMPDYIELYEEIQLEPAVISKYKQFEKTLYLDFENSEVEALSAATLANKLLQYCAGAVYVDEFKNYEIVHDAKLDALADIIEQNDGENILVAYNFKSDLERLLKRFPDGRVLDKHQSTIDEWNNGEIPLLFAHPQSAGHGLNIQHGGSMIVWFSLSWSLEYYQQFNARLYRQGQTMAVRIIHLICKGCIDERIINVLKDKDIVQSDLLRALK